MLTSFFSNSRPINFIVVAVYIFIFYLFANLQALFSAPFWVIWQEVGMFLFLFSILFREEMSLRGEMPIKVFCLQVFFACLALHCKTMML